MSSEESEMTYEFECSDLFPACEETLAADTQDEVLEETTKHVRESHGMIELPNEWAQRVLASIGPRDDA